MSIPLSKTGVDDSFYWVWDKEGKYTVKSGYHRLLESNYVVSSAAVTSWQSVWSMAVPPKVWHGKTDPPARVRQMAEELYVQ
ncbi:hypothetical protein LguiA_018273 [Lonicera macranthoides]